MNSTKLNYIPGLDGIRALAAFLVISTHWPNNMLSLKFGWIGVNIFFVLSGFLITRILVNSKQESLRNYFSTFYYKRMLRIFPLYYAFVIVTGLIILLISCYVPAVLTHSDWQGGLYAVKHDLVYYLTYTYNLKINLRYFIHFPDSSNRFFGHLWSLSLEEQFYLIFPFLVYFSSVQTLKKVTIAVLIICPLLRLWGVLYGASLVTDHYWLGEFFYSNTFCQADSLFTGAALALFSFRLYKPFLNFILTFTIWLTVGIICFIMLRRAGYFLVPFKSLGYDFPGFWFDEKTSHWWINIRPFYQYTIVNLLAALLIWPAINHQALFPKVFEDKRVIYFGKISYGIYLFHNPLLIGLVIFADVKLGGWYQLTSSPLMEIGCFIIYFSLVTMLAHLSYQYFEKKLLRYKQRLKPVTVSA